MPVYPLCRDIGNTKIYLDTGGKDMTDKSSATKNGRIVFDVDAVKDHFRIWLTERAERLRNDNADTPPVREGRLAAVMDALDGHLSDMDSSPDSIRDDPFSEGYGLEARAILKLVEYREDPNPVTLAVDFDNTLARSVSSYPDIGEEIPEAFRWLSIWLDKGVRLILWTMRTGDGLSDALSFCAARGISFWGVNENPAQAIYPHPASRKCFSNFLIDDTAIGCPLDDQGAVDWSVMGPLADKVLDARLTRA